MNIFGTHDKKTIEQFKDVSSRAVRSALMADGHVGYVMPIGGVAAYHNLISVVGVGFDIACGNAAIRTDRKLSDLGQDEQKLRWLLGHLADEIQHSISFGVGRHNKADDAPTSHPLFENDAWNAIPRAYRNVLYDKAKGQLGTVGSGNHYVDVFVDDDDYIWVGVHFGSRGLGHTIATAYLAISQGGQWGDRAPEQEVLLSLDSQAGREYWALMNLAGAYAYAGREWVARKVVSLLGAKEAELIHNHHNFAWQEWHRPTDDNSELALWKDSGLLNENNEAELIVVRKGATPAFPGQRGFVGGSMGDNSVILQGRDVLEDTDAVARLERDPALVLEQQRSALYSTIHGAGRVMSRTEAAGKRNYWRKLKSPIEPGKISREMMAEWLTRTGVILRGGGVDESPHVYRRLNTVLSAQGETIKVLHNLKPLIVVMAGDDVRDPYKD